MMGKVLAAADSPNSNWIRVFRIAVLSRLTVLILIVLFRSVASPYDTSGTINPDCLSSFSSNSVSAKSIIFPDFASAIESSIVWDGVYFVRIAQCGYEYEQAYAFFPLLPLCMRLLSLSVLAPLVPFIGQRAVLGLSGYLINNVAFVLSAIYFYRLSALVLEDYSVAFLASILFCFNPASIFYSSIYSESLYSLFYFGGIYHLLFSGGHSISVLMLALSGSVRSNGVLNAGYLCFQTLHQIYDGICTNTRVHVTFWRIILATFQILCIFAPFIAFQTYGYLKICLGCALAHTRPWCKVKVPLLYDFIQNHYWGVGFLRYFHLKQLPNFFLASPILSLAICSVVKYMKTRPEMVLYLGFQSSSKETNVGTSLNCTESVMSQKCAENMKDPSRSIPAKNYNLYWRRSIKVTSERQKNFLSLDLKHGYFSIWALPFVLHLCFMTFMAIFVIHVQVATRFLSSSPPLYWFASYLIVSGGRSKYWGYLIWRYFVAYFLLGSLLFSNFYPFT